MAMMAASSSSSSMCNCYLKVEHKGLTGEIKLKDGMRTEFQLDVMDKVRLTSYVLFRQREKSI